MMFCQILVVIIIVLYTICRWSKKEKYELYEEFKSGKWCCPVIGHGWMLLGNKEGLMTTLSKSGDEAIKNGGVASFWMAYKLYLVSKNKLESPTAVKIDDTTIKNVNKFKCLGSLITSDSRCTPEIKSRIARAKQAFQNKKNLLTVIADPVVAETILKTTAEKNEFVKFIRMLTGNGLVFTPASLSKSRRKILAPNLNQRNLNQFVEIFAKQSGVLVERLRVAEGTSSFPMWKYLTRYTLDSLYEATLGVQLYSQNIANLPFVRAFEECCHLIVDRITKPWLYAPFIYDYSNNNWNFTKNKKLVVGIIEQIIKYKRYALKQRNNDETSTNKMKSILELLLESTNGSYSDDELIEEILALILAGSDTSAAVIGFAAKLLAWNPGMQENVYQEILDVLGSSDSARPITVQDLPQLKKLEAVIKETLRLYPPVPILIPSLEKDTQIASGMIIPSDTGIVINIRAMHRNPKHWGCDAELFKPERFLDGSTNPAFKPFSGGLRTCLGNQFAMMMMKTSLATIIRNFQLIPSSEENHMKLEYDLLMKDVDNYQIKLKTRI